MGDGGVSGAEAAPLDVPLTRRVLVIELVVVLAVALGPSILEAFVVLVRYLVGGRAAIISFSRLPTHPWADSSLLVVVSIAGTLPVLLVPYVLLRSNESLASIGLRRDNLARDLSLGFGLAVILLIAAGFVIGPLRAVGIHTIESRSRLLDRWPYEPAWLVESLRAGFLEELVVCGYFLHRLRQLGWSDNRALVTSTAVRASYHVYGGIPLVAFTLVFGAVMGRVYQRTKRLTAIVAAHAMYDGIVFTIAVAHYAR